MPTADDSFSFANVIDALLTLDCWHDFPAGPPNSWAQPIHFTVSLIASPGSTRGATPDSVIDSHFGSSLHPAADHDRRSNHDQIICMMQGADRARCFSNASLLDCLSARGASTPHGVIELQNMVEHVRTGQAVRADAVGMSLRRNDQIVQTLFSISCTSIGERWHESRGVLISCTELIAPRTDAPAKIETLAAKSPATTLLGHLDNAGNADNIGTAGDAEVQRALEQQLRIENEQSRHLLDSMTEGFAFIEADWTISHVNAEGLRLAGRNISEVIGHNVWEVWPHMRGTMVETEFERVMEHGQSVNFEQLLSFASCDERWYDIRIFPALRGGLAIFCRDVTPSRDLQESLRKAELLSRTSNSYLRLLLDTMTEGLYALDRTMKVTMCNAAFVRMLGFSSVDEIVGHEIHEKIHHSYPDGSPYPRDACHIYCAARDGTSAYVDDEVFFRRDGTSFPVEYRVRPVWQDGELCGTMCTFSDISDRKRTEQALKESEQHFRSLFAHHMDAILATHLDGSFYDSNTMMHELTGYSHSELRNLKIGDLAPEDEADIPRAHFMLAINGTSQKFQSSIRRKDGRLLQCELTHIPIIVEGGVIGVFVVIRDITAATNYERHIRYLASHDALTGLPNRNLLDDRLRHAIFQRGTRQVGVLFLDLNRFKMINDSLGHDKGDLLLKIVAERMKVALRQGDTIARLGGDEFVVVLEKIDSIEQIASISQKLLAEVEQSINLEGHEVSISTSIGIAVYPKDGEDADTLLKHADLAMYQAKNAGSGTFRFFSPEMNIKTLERLLNETGLRRVIDRNELIVHYQPRINVLTGATVGVEALVRWFHPERGIISPNDFIPLAEEIGMIGAIGEWVLRAACQQNRAWQDAGLPRTKMSINLSAHQLLSPLFADTLETIVRESGLDVKWIELEITETSLMQNIDASLDTLIKIQAMGISMSIDDFGTGYSSLSYLKKLPVDTLKIDQSFIRDLLDHPDDAVIVAATIGLAHSMGLQVVAEGVATVEQARFLIEKDCTTMQGFLFSRPLSAAQCGLFLHEGGAVFQDKAFGLLH